MNAVAFPWIHSAIVVPIVAAFVVGWMRDSVRARLTSLVACGLVLTCTVGAWSNLALWHHPEHSWNSLSTANDTILVLDELNAPLLPLIALLFFLTALATIGAKVQRFSFTSMLVTEGILLATLCCTQPWMLVSMLAAGAIPLMVELYRGRRPLRVFVIYMALFVVLLTTGLGLLDSQPADSGAAKAGVVMLLAAVLVRTGVLPFHSWMPDLFENASFGSALLYVTPMVGQYATVRLVFPIAPPWLLDTSASLALVTSLYAAGMALVQREARQLFCYLFLSHSSLVLVGLDTATPLAVTAALCMWISVALAMTGFGLTLRAIESRARRLSLDRFHGLYKHTPRLAALFLISGLAAVGFPGTIGFVSSELLVNGTVSIKPVIGAVIMVVAALNGIAVMHVYFRVFAGTPHISSIDMICRRAEMVAVLVLSGLILGGGIYPQPGTESRYSAARKLVDHRLQFLSGETLQTSAERRPLLTSLVADTSPDSRP